MSQRNKLSIVAIHARNRTVRHFYTESEKTGMQAGTMEHFYCMYIISFPAGNGTIASRHVPAATCSGFTSVTLDFGT